MENDLKDKAVFAKTMYGTAEDFGGTVSEEGLFVRFKALQEFSIDQVTTAGTWLLRHREATFPAVPTTKEFIDVIEHSGSPNQRLKAEIEADKVLGTLKEYGRDAEPLFYDKITTYLMTTRWTFQKLDTMNIDDPGLKWWRKDFVQAYQDIGKNRDTGSDVLCLSAETAERLESISAVAVKLVPGKGRF